jgi:predicted GIY-YIG superfamily endonuclease
MNDYVVYVLVNTSHNKTYVGITNNPTRRLRQHNGELVGGAKYTTANKGTGEWLFYGFIRNLEKRQSLSLEKRIKIKSRKLKGLPIEKRINAIHLILCEFNELYFDILFNPTL